MIGLVYNEIHYAVKNKNWCNFFLLFKLVTYIRTGTGWSGMIFLVV